MKPDHWQKVEQLYHAALEREESQRARFIKESSAGDEELWRDVESLLGYERRAEGIFESPVEEVVKNLLRSEDLRSPGIDGPDPNLVGKSVSHYRILEALGSGGMGVVYRAEDTRLKRTVALKLLRARLAEDRIALRRFQSEACAASALDHPNICAVYDTGEQEGRPFIVMQYLEGQTLRELLKEARSESGRSKSDMGMVREPSLPLDHLLDLAIQIADALEAAHDQGIIHRDIKPANIFITRGWQVKILDFGLAKRTFGTPWPADKPSTYLTTPGMAIGTVPYMSPEQARGGKLDARSDLFSFGALLYEMAAGQPAFPPGNPAIAFDAILNRDPVSILTLNPELPPKLESIVVRALEKDRALRYQHAWEIRSDLKRLKRQVDSGLFGVAERGASVASEESSVRTLRRSAHLGSLVVLPFENLSGDPENDYLSDGISESLMNTLSQTRSLRVVSRSTAFRYKGRQASPQSIGRELGVQAVLTGRVLPKGDQLAVGAELVDVKTDSQLWGQQYKRKFADIFEIQDEISGAICEKLVSRFIGQEAKLRPAKRHTQNQEAYELYLRGQYFFNTYTEQGTNKSAEYFQRAAEKDPNFALAYVGLAQCYHSMSILELAPPADVSPRALAAATKALELDNSLAEAYTFLAMHKFSYEWDWAGAEELFERAIELQPDLALAYHWYTLLNCATCRLDEAVDVSRKALELDPLSTNSQYFASIPLHGMRDFDAALEHLHKALELDPRHGWAHWIMGIIYEQKHMYEEAVASERKAVETTGGVPRARAGLGHACGLARRRVEAEGILAELQEQAKRAYVSPFAFATVYLGLREFDAFFGWLEKAFAARSFWLVYLKMEPQYDPVRSDDRFQDLIRRMKFPG
jgi:serine/threonine protein kinase/tetratricopeptide (TPR) repeat protein